MLYDTLIEFCGKLLTEIESVFSHTGIFHIKVDKIRESFNEEAYDIDFISDAFGLLITVSENDFYLTGIEVNEENRCRGLATKLINLCHDFSKERGIQNFEVLAVASTSIEKICENLDMKESSNNWTKTFY